MCVLQNVVISSSDSEESLDPETAVLNDVVIINAEGSHSLKTILIKRLIICVLQNIVISKIHRLQISSHW
jgi:hypothetical protein